MRESIQHQQLVLKGAKYIEETYSKLNDVMIDELSDLGTGKFLYLLRFEPDIVAEGNDVLVIGEAKTEKDVLTKHSKQQYIDYLEYGDDLGREVYFYLFVPWKVKASANNYLKNLSKQLGVPSSRWTVVSEVELVKY